MIIKHKKTADYIHWASKIATSANKHADKIIYKIDSTSIEFKKGDEFSELILLYAKPVMCLLVYLSE